MCREEISEILERFYRKTDVEQKDKLLLLKETLNTIYGEERNCIVKQSVDDILELLELTDEDLQEELSSDCLYDIDHRLEQRAYTAIIHFPEIEITNTKEQKHTIRDLYVRLLFEKDMRVLVTLEGRRGTVTYKESRSKYSHSHLRATGYSYWQPFCFGSGDIILALPRVRNSFTKINLIGLFFIINNYVKWESLEGGPHFNMAGLQYVQGITSLPEIDFEEPALKRMLGSILEVVTLDELLSNFIIEINRHFVKIAHKPSLALLLARIPFLSETLGIPLCYLENGNWVGIGNISTTQRGEQREEELFKFKNEIIKLRIINDEVQESKNEIKYIHPEFPRKFTFALSKYLTKSAFKVKRDELKNRIESLSGATESNSMAV